MLRPRAVPAPLLAALLTVSACGPRATPTTVGKSEAPQASAAPSAAIAPSTSIAESTAANYADPSKLLAEYDEGDPQGLALHPAQPGKSGITVTVQESGPDMPWLVRIDNQGTAPAELFADTRLLWFEVRLDGNKKSTTCKLPAQLGPSEAEPRLRITLNPGEGVLDQFDPRLYCFAEGDQKLLVPGAQITPHFGWAEAPPKTLWRGGKRISEPTLQLPPFVAQGQSTPASTSPATTSPASGKTAEPAADTVDASDGSKGRAKRAAKASPKKKAPAPKSKATLLAEAVAAVSDKELVGNTFTLRSDYAVWSRRAAKAPEPSEVANVPALAIHLTQGSDARAEYNATVQMSLENQSKSATRVYFRRELVTFEVTGPKGVTLCDPSPDDHSPEKQAFLSLAPHAKRAYTSRLAELCPRGTFATPGLYLVYARFDAKLSGEQWGLSAFTGPVLSEKPAAIRIRTGDSPFLQKRMMALPKAPSEPAAAAAPNPPEANPGTPAPTPAKLPAEPPSKSQATP